MLHDRVALTRGFLKSFAVDNSYCAPRVLDIALPLEDTRRQSDARAICSEHGSQKIMCDVQGRVVNPVLHDQKPASQSLLYTVESVAGRRLRSLHSLNHRVQT